MSNDRSQEYADEAERLALLPVDVQRQLIAEQRAIARNPDVPLVDREYARQHGAVTIGTYTEVESGTNSERPELKRAIAHAKRSKATLVISKLVRLARNVAFTSALMESGVNFVCVTTHTPTS